LHLADEKQKLERKLLTKSATVADLTLNAAMQLIDDDKERVDCVAVFAADDGTEKALLKKLEARQLIGAQRTTMRLSVVAGMARRVA